jgi:hypothetical protein
VPDFDKPNITNIEELADILAEVAASAGLERRNKWSVTLPEVSIRTTIITIETPMASRAELDEMLRWKVERGFSTPFDELQASWMPLSKDSRGRERYLAVAIRKAVLSDYETVFERLGWHAGFVLPRHMGELSWLSNHSRNSDDLLISSHYEGFTAVILRDGEILLIRSIPCEDDESCTDEIYRLLLFYKDRLLQADEVNIDRTIERLLIVGHKFNKNDIHDIITETLQSLPQTLTPEDLGMSLPSEDLDFDMIAAPAGLAKLSLN